MKRTNFHRAQQRRGVILAVVLIVMVVVSFMVLGFWQLSALDGLESGLNLTSTKAFWAAEAGVYDALVRLNNNASFRQSPSNFNGMVTGATYSVSVVAGTLFTNFTIISTGTVGRSYRIVQQTTAVVTNWPSAFDYMLAGFGGSMEIKNNDVITGNVYQVGSIDVGNSTVDGTEYSTSSGVLPNPQPSPPNPDFSWYNGQVSGSHPWGSMPSGNLTSGPTIYVNTANATITQTIQGPRTLVFTNNVTISGVIGPNVWIIAGGTITLNSNVGDLNLMFATTEIDLGSSHNFGQQNVLLTPGNITWKQKIVFNGIMYAGGQIGYSNGSGDITLTGSAVAGGGFNFKNLGGLAYDPSEFPSLPPGFTGVPMVSTVQWSER